jgi:predicted nucleotidyltransferase
VPEKSDINRVTVPLVVKMSTDTDPLDILNLVTELQYLLGKKVIIIEHSQMSAEMRENMIVEGKVIC